MVQGLAVPPVDSGLLDLTHVRLAELFEPDSTLEAVMRRLFDPAEDADRPVSAFQSAL